MSAADFLPARISLTSLFAYVLFTVSLYQKGSAESKKLDEEEPVDRDPRPSRRRDAPWPVRKGGIVLTLYEWSTVAQRYRP